MHKPIGTYLYGMKEKKKKKNDIDSILFQVNRSECRPT